MIPEVLILSSKYDFSTDLVSLRLRDLGIPFLRLNREDLCDLRLTLDPVKPSLRVRGINVEAKVNENLKSVWFRQPVFLRNTPHTALSVSNQLERSQWNAFMRALSVFDKAVWMNFPQATYLAECKPYQLLIASRCGFLIPSTLVSNDALAIKAANDSCMIVKSLDTVLLRDGQDCLFTYSTISNSEDLTDENVAAAPVIAQKLLSGKTDIRVTVIGDTIFAVRIYCNGTGIEGDWRVCSKDSLSYEDVVLSPAIEMSCKALVRNLGLTFAAIDLIETAEDTYIIEINPTGEWGWISNTERPIDAAIASWLLQPYSMR
jgi:glutathione synthase/RimK-type ligase-like ATP-grasp enzyme